MKTIKISTVAKTATFAVVAAAIALGLARPADAAAGTMYGDPVAAAKWWRHQQYDDCVLMASADVIGQMTGKEPSEQAIIKKAQLPPVGPTSGPMPAASQPTPAPQYYQGSSGNWGGPPPGTPPVQQFAGPTPWNQTPPKPKRNPWPIIAAVAVVLVAVVGGVGIWLIVRPKPVPPPRPHTVGSSWRTAAEFLRLNSIVGSSDMQPGKPVTSMDTFSYTLSLPQCQGAVYPAEKALYEGTDYQAVSGLMYQDPKHSQGQIRHLVDENVISFPTADKAEAFVQTAHDKWKACAGQPITITDRGNTYRWTFGQVNGDPPKITLTRTQEGAQGWACQHAISAANNIVADIDACDYNLNNQASQAAEQIVAKVNNA